MNPEILLNLSQIAVLALVLLGTVRLLGTAPTSLTAAFFAFAIAGVLLSDLYWLAYDLLRPGTRMPFAANEIGEWAMFLLLGAALLSRCTLCLWEARRETLGAAAFAAACAALWIAWSGEWVQDVLTGLSYGYLLCALSVRAKEEAAFFPVVTRAFAALCVLLIAAQTATFFAPEAAARALDLFCSVLLLSGTAAQTALALRSLKRKDAPGAGVCRAFAAFAGGVCTMYMSSGAVYSAALLLTTLCFPLMLAALAAEKEAAA